MYIDLYRFKVCCASSMHRVSVQTQVCKRPHEYLPLRHPIVSDVVPSNPGAFYFRFCSPDRDNVI